MKKVLFALMIAGTFAACNNSTPADGAKKDSSAVAVDSSKKAVVDSTAKADTSKKAVADTTKKADSTAKK